VPELAEPGLTMTEDAPNMRMWSGVIEGDTYARFAGGWDLQHRTDQPHLGMLTEHGHLACHTYT
jgi:hypothetical protein